MHVGLCVLRLSPDTFWALSPREFLAATGGLRPITPIMERAGLDALMRQFPDDGGNDGRR